MFILKYLKSGNTYIVDAQYINNNVVQITGSDFKSETSGFTLSREDKEDEWDYSAFKTIYRTVDNGVQFSNNESVYVETSSIQVIWNDSDDKEVFRPLTIDVAVKKNNRKFETITLSSENEWQYSYIDSVTIPKYSISVSDVPEYIAEIKGLIITETHEVTPEPVPVEPSWEDKMEAQLMYTAMETDTLLDIDVAEEV